MPPSSISILAELFTAPCLSINPINVTEDRIPTHLDRLRITKRYQTKNVLKSFKFHRGCRHVLVKDRLFNRRSMKWAEPLCQNMG